MPRVKVEKKDSRQKTKAEFIGKVFNEKAEFVKEQILPEKIFGVKVQKKQLAVAVRIYLANKRFGLADTKTRGEIRGGGRKPWKEKGTGRARQGSIRAPHWRGGGIIFGPTPKSFVLKMPKKIQSLNLKMALSMKAKNNQVSILNAENKFFNKTKTANNLLQSIYPKDIKSKTLIVYSDENKETIKYFFNLKNVFVENVKNLNALLVLNNKNILFFKEAIEYYG